MKLIDCGILIFINFLTCIKPGIPGAQPVRVNFKSTIIGCIDSDYGATDNDGEDCSWYDDEPSYCGSSSDDDDFNSNEMCCACGGGVVPVTTNSTTKRGSVAPTNVEPNSTITIDLETSSYESTYDADITLINNQSNRPSTDGVTTPSLNFNQTDEGHTTAEEQSTSGTDNRGIAGYTPFFAGLFTWILLMFF